MIRFVLTFVLVCMATVAHAQQKRGPEWVRLGWGIEPWHEKTVRFDAHVQEVLFGNNQWVKHPGLCARNEVCIFALGKDLVIIKSKEPWLKNGYVIQYPGTTRQEEALFAQPCEPDPMMSVCEYSRLDGFYGQLYVRANFIFEHIVKK